MHWVRALFLVWDLQRVSEPVRAAGLGLAGWLEPVAWPEMAGWPERAAGPARVAGLVRAASPERAVGPGNWACRASFPDNLDH